MQQADVKEDEEQGVRFQEIIDLLLAAGYFRARIKGLSSFDKIAGGMCWCITTCNYDVNVDLLFQENSTIGQRISLTEKLVAVLLKMKCPHRIEPHQIQGLDFIHILPVMQWLVSKAMETRKEQGDYLASYAQYQFARYRGEVSGERWANTLVASRKLRRRDAEQLRGMNEAVRVQSTLLEYGVRAGGAADGAPGGATPDAGGAAGDAGDAERLLSNMAAAGGDKPTAAAVGNIIADRAAQLHHAVGLYEQLRSASGGIDTSALLLSPAEQLQRDINALRQNIARLDGEQQQLDESLAALRPSAAEWQQRWRAMKKQMAGVEARLAEMEAVESSPEERAKLERLRQLTIEKERLESELAAATSGAEQERASLEQQLHELTERQRLLAAGDAAALAGDERLQQLNAQLAGEQTKLQSVRQQLAALNRDYVNLLRKLERAPSRVELSQYQKRFLELYDQVAVLHRQTKQFYELYNVLHDKRSYLQKEVQLLESVADGYRRARGANPKEPAGSMSEFLKQFELVAEGVTQSQQRLEQRKATEKARRDQLTAKLQRLLELQRQYARAVRDLEGEFARNDALGRARSVAVAS